MKNLFAFGVICLILIGIISCEKRDESTTSKGSIYGLVTDKVTGEPLQGVTIKLSEIGEVQETGSDGSYEFVNISDGSYSLQVSKNGYYDPTDKIKIIIADGRHIHRDIQLEKIPPTLIIYDDKKMEIDILDFGSDYGVTSRSFQLFNSEDKKLNWSIQYDSNCKWLIGFSQTEGQIMKNLPATIVVSIDRHKLKLGQNKTLIHILSENSGNKELLIVATGVNVVETLSATDIKGKSAVLNGKIVSNLNPSITEYGFVYSTSPAPTLTNGSTKVCKAGTPQNGVYDMLISELSNPAKYYVRAYVTNTIDTIYGEQVSFETQEYKPIIKVNAVRYLDNYCSVITVDYSISHDGGLPLEEVGICYGTSPLFNTETTNCIVTGNEKKDYVNIVEDIKPNKTYYLRVYAHNAESIGYSETLQFTTSNAAPGVWMSKNFSQGADYIVASGFSMACEEYPILEQGICYSTTSTTPTIYDVCVPAETNSSSYTVKLTGLNSCTTYFCRAYAKNVNGDIAYSECVVDDDYECIRDSRGFIEVKTKCEPAIVSGYIYDEDGNSVKNVKVGIANSNGTISSKYNSTTNELGYYEILFDLQDKTSTSILALAEYFESKEKPVTILPGQSHQLNFTLSLKDKYLVDLGTGYWADGSSNMIFENSQKSMAGMTQQLNMRIRNNRSVPVSFSISNIPTKGVYFSETSGELPASSEISIPVTFTYPTTKDVLMSLSSFCSSGGKTYLYNWENKVTGTYVSTHNIVDSYNKVIGIGYSQGYSECAACCQQHIYLRIGEETANFTLTFNQFVVY